MKIAEIVNTLNNMHMAWLLQTPKFHQVCFISYGVYLLSSVMMSIHMRDKCEKKLEKICMW